MNNFFDLITDYTFLIVAVGSGLLGVLSGIIGVYVVVKKQGLICDAISHSTLPGVCIIFMILGLKNLQWLLLGAFIFGILSAFLIFVIDLKSKVKFDSALATVLSTFFGLGVVLLAVIQRKANTNQAGLDKFIFGQAAAFLKRDIYFLFVIIVFVLLTVFIFWKELKLYSFDPEFAQTKGFSTSILNSIVIVLLVISIVMGIQSVGVVLMSTMLIAPAVAARQWTDKFHIMMILSAVFGMLSGVFGAFISMYFDNLSTGPVITIVASVIVFFSLLFSPGKGIVFSKRRTKVKKGVF
ncbi:MAG: iron chelate uptake ABC transporter family permease subunit [Peptoniphilaceae bacterium]|uniref:metal ABC transporter permease n=1 Tax=Parvimonas sp. TaxID=1944660 RepID=UPI0025D7A0E2|nr:iron chelate uptake ABC transporter family permease subunit [Parvimonas sp.]MCI5997484.1 metal ABC transporter permease [Parvimonas sp.]MDD7764670.1 iron chelate uptake ABC transporter family permease subunit [Peptoniphilaceae bacterium]MDY3050956.1 iron chelate uptake ABC transporter family permease subunit [Parvimonas sp.]